MTTAILNVPDISCEHCQNTIAKALMPVDGVRDVNVDIPSKRVTVEYDDATIGIEQLREILADEDYPVESVEEGRA
jgi:copper chaperone